MVEAMKIMATSFKRSQAGTAILSALDPLPGHYQPTPLPETFWTHMGNSRSDSCRVTAPFSWILVHTRFCFFLPRVCFPGLCKFWQLFGGVNGSLLQEGLCHTQVCCTQSPCPGYSPLLTHTSIGDTQTQVCLSLCGDLWDLVHTRFV